MTEITVQPPLDIEESTKLEQDISAVVDQISSHEVRLASSYARLGGLLRKVKVGGFWQGWGYKRFSSYLEMIRERIDRRRSQVYAILSVAETLLPYLTEEQLETIGISRAHELRRLVKQGGSLQAYVDVEIDHPRGFDVDNEGSATCTTTVQLMDFAARPEVTALRLRAAVNNILHVKEGPLGNWYEMPGFYATPDEKKEIEQFWELGRRVLEIGPEESEHEAKKQVMLAAARECAGQWSSEVSNA